MIHYAILSKDGGRSINEDTVAVREGARCLLCVLADGLGGHGGGEVASALAVEACLTTYDAKAVPFEEMLAVCIVEAQNSLLTEQRRIRRMDDIKTTIALLQFQEDRIQWAHVGDSRVYHFAGHKLVARTLDHSVPQMLVNQGEIREKDIRFHEDRNRLVRVLGMEWDTPKFEVSQEHVLIPPASFLLCSDGFWELIDEKEMGKLLKRSQSPLDWLTAMEGIILKNGRNKKMDNYSAIAVFVR